MHELAIILIYCTVGAVIATMIVERIFKQGEEDD